MTNKRCGEPDNRVVDYVLKKRKEWRQYVEMMEPRTGGSVVVLPIEHGRIGDPVAAIAVSRATITMVLDAVERTLRRLPKLLRQVAHLKYDEGLTYPEIAARVGYSSTTVKRSVERIRRRVKITLHTMSNDVIAAFWRELDRILTRN